MKRISLFTLGTGLILLLGPASSRGADDKIADDLEKAKTKFEADTKKLRADIQDDFDRRLTKARDKGDKKLVEKIKDEQKVFDMHGILASTANKDLKKRATELGKLIEKAYSDAKKAYFKAKKDELAAAVEKEWKHVQTDGLITIAQQPELWIPLFNGTDFREWEQWVKPAVPWKVMDGAIQGENKEKNGNEIKIDSVRNDFDDFHLRMEVSCTPNTVAHVYFRGNWGAGSTYCLCLKNGKQEAGSLIKENKTIRYRTLKNAEGPSPPDKEWFTIELIAKGYSFTTIVNGEKKVEVTDEDKVSAKGHFGIALAESGSMLRIRKIEILPLSSPEKK